MDRLALVTMVLLSACRDTPWRSPDVVRPAAAVDRPIRRFDRFGNEGFWTDTLRMHEVIAGQGLGGVGDGLSPVTALALGLKVDVDALPLELVTDLTLGWIDLGSASTMVTLLKLDAVVGVRATVDANSRITTFGITCALCHSTVDNSFAVGIGRRRVGWPNRDLQRGMILSLSPGLQSAADQAVLASWGKRPSPSPDFVPLQMPALLRYQLSVTAEAPLPDAFDTAAVASKAAVLARAEPCANCHAQRPILPLREPLQHPPYAHDGGSATLEAVVDHFVGVLGIRPQQAN